MSVSKSTKFCFVLAILLCIISMVGAKIIQTDNCQVTVKDMRIETSLGREFSFLLFIPPNATKETPAPAVVVSHGWYNNREMQDINYVELARRGFVVASIDMYGHGNSDALPASEVAVQGTGMYDAVEFLATLPYVNKEYIGVTGHSNGARAANFSIDVDNTKETPLIHSVLLIGNDANYVDADKNFYNKYGSRDVGIIGAKYDEFFFRTYGNGTVTAPRDFLDQATAQSFLNFGKDPNTEDLEKRESYTMYTENVDGVDAIRVIYHPDEIHPWNHFSKKTTVSAIEFFQKTLPVPHAIPAEDQVWPIKAAFNALGLLGVALLVVSFTKIMLRTSFFSSLLTEEHVEALPSPGAYGQMWFLISLVISVIFSALSYIYLYGPTQDLVATLATKGGVLESFMHQRPPLFIGIWSLANGLFTLVLIFIGSKIVSVEKVTAAQRGVTIGFGNFLKTILLSVIVVFVAYIPVFTADILFLTDFRLWVLPLKAFTADKLYYVAIYLPFFLVFYIINSIAINCFNYIKGLPEFLNITLLAIVNGLSSAIMICVQYYGFMVNGRAPLEIMFGGVGFNIIGIWLFPIVIFLPLAAFFMRSIFKDTRNPYLGAFIFAIIVTIISCTNTLTELPL